MLGKGQDGFIMNRFTLIISAAGLSSRMGDFKPLMKVDGVENIIRELDTYFGMGINRALVITGYRAEDIISAVRAHYPENGEREVVFLHNPAYAATHMYDSLKIGLQYVKDVYASAAAAEGPDGPYSRSLQPGCAPEDVSGVLTLPVDVPMTAPFTIRKILTTACSAGPDAIYPECCGEPGHPIFINAAALDKFLAFEGRGGLRGAYLSENMKTVRLWTPDHGSIMDSDTPEAFARLLSEAEQRRCPDRERCEEILRFFVVDQSLLAHSAAVAALAREMAEKTGLDADLCYAGGMLHDIAKGLKKHAEAGADCLSDLGYERVSSLVRTHTELPEEYTQKLNENLIVFLADKMVRRSTRVTIDERFAPKREKFRDDPEAMRSFERRYALAKRCEQLYIEQSGQE